MELSEQIRARCGPEMDDYVDTISDRTGFDRSEIIRRLVRLGLEDVDDIGDEVLLGPTETPDPPELADDEN